MKVFTAFRRSSLLLSLCFILSGVQAQTYIADYQHWSVKEGLSHRRVRSIFEDSRGFMWFGTKYGLNRFDGYQFQWFTEQDGIADNLLIRSMLEDAEGRLWLFGDNSEFPTGHALSVNILDVKTLELQPLSAILADSIPLQEQQLTGGFLNEQGTTWIGTNAGVLLQHSAQKGFSVVPIDDMGDQAFQPIKQIHHFLIGWIKDKEGFRFASIDLEKRQLEVYTNYPLIHLLWFSQKIDEQIWFSFQDVSDTYHIAHFSLPASSTKPIYTEVEDRQYGPIVYIKEGETESIWSCDKQLNVEFPPADFQLDLADAYPSTTNIEAFYVDSHKQVWIAGMFGVSAFRIGETPFQTFLEEEDVNDYVGIECRGISEDQQGNIYVGSYQGLYKLQKNKEQFREKQLVDADFYLGTICASDDYLWLGTGTNFLQKWNPERQKIEDIPTNLLSEVNQNYRIWSFCETKDSTIWLGCLKGGLYYRDKSDGLIRAAPNQSQRIRDNYILDFHEGKDGRVWMATGEGVYIFQPKPFQVLAHYWKGGEGKNYLPSNQIYHIHEDSDGIFWLATGGDGLLRWNPETGEYTKITRTKGLASNVIYAVYEDQEGFLWMSSDYGIIRLDKESFQSTAYLPEDGTSHFEFNRISHHQSRDGKIWFGSLNGLTSFYPQDVSRLNRVNNASLQITDLRIFVGAGDSLVDQTADFLRDPEIIMQPNDRFFDIEFSLLLYRNQENVRYAYRIEPIEEEWTFTNEPHIRISGLPNGKHTLIIKAQAPDGQFAADIKRIPLDIIPAIHERTWFYPLILLLILIVGFLIFQIRTRALRANQLALETEVKRQTEKIQQDKALIEEQAEELRHLDHIKSRFFANVSHELRTPLTLIISPLRELLKRNQQKLPKSVSRTVQTAVRNASKMHLLIEEILLLSRLEADKVEAKLTPIQFIPLMQKTMAAFDGLAALNQIHYQFHSNIDPEAWILLDVPKYEKIVNNLLSNAFKFTPSQGRILLKVEEQANGTLLTEVSDTGMGIPKRDLPKIFDRFYQSSQKERQASGGTGIGLAFSKELAEVLEGEIWVKSEIGKGSSFFLSIPFQYTDALQQTTTPKEALYTEIHEEELIEAVKLEKKARVLVVEDHPDMREFLVYLLKQQYEVREAMNGRIALEILEKEAVDLVLSDVMMPEVDGFTLLETLKSGENTWQLPVVMLTARSDKEDRLHALRLGVDDYLTKPFVAEELQARIHNLLRNAQLRQLVREEMAAEEKLTLVDEAANEQEYSNHDKIDFSSQQQEWLARVEELVLRNAGETDFTVARLADEMHMSERRLRSNLKALTGLTPKQYIRTATLEKARQMLGSKNYRTVAEVAEAVGYKTPEYFSRTFEKEFGRRPTELLQAS